MKNIILLSTLFISPLLAQATATPPATPPATSKAAQINTATTPANRLNTGWWEKRHEEKVAAAQGAECDLIFIGDSITHSWEGAGKKVWQKYYAARKPFNIGFSGDRTQHVLWRMDNGELAKFQPKVAVIMIGTNNTGHNMQKAEETAAGVQAIITKLHEHSPKTKVLLLAIFPRGATAKHKMRKHNDSINAILKTYDNGKTVYYLDLAPAFLDKAGNLPKSVMPDRLHPKAGGYQIWAETMEPKLKELMGE
jgi:lysophospholipase L1-like esterase